MLSEDTMQKLAEAIAEEMVRKKHTLWLDPEAHSEQHKFIQELIAERAEKLARRKAIQDKIAGSLILTGLLSLVTMLGAGFMDYVRNHM